MADGDPPASSSPPPAGTQAPPSHPVVPNGTITASLPTPFGSQGPAPPGAFYPAAIAAIIPASVGPEGDVTFAYQDRSARHYVTTGIGYLIDSVAAAQRLPWLINGNPATPEEISDQWKLVHDNTDATLYSGNADKIPGNTMRLTREKVRSLTLERARQMARTILNAFPNVAQWPADGHLAILTVTWGTGASLRNLDYMSAFVAAVDADDFDQMRGTATWSNQAADRRALTQLLFSNASFVRNQKGDLSTVNWPRRLSDAVVAVGGTGPNLDPAPPPPAPPPPPWPGSP